MKLYLYKRTSGVGAKYHVFETIYLREHFITEQFKKYGQFLKYELCEVEANFK